jgi:crotonobetainyl-CoA:carnitine CoA-transferase CaiB-like acyl-CoA transferase
VIACWDFRAMPEHPQPGSGQPPEDEPGPAPDHVVAGCLNGIRVLELGQLISGTYGGMLLADFGADVIKVEPPAGDIGRNPNVSPIESHSALFLTMNRGKRSVVLDLKTDAGRAVFYRLVAATDVVIANFRPGVLHRLGIDYDRLRAVNPGVILCDISGFGRDAPLPHPPSFDLTHQALSGLMGVTGEPGRGPVRVGIPIADLATALFAALGVLAALVQQGRTAVGSDIHLSMLHTASFLLNYDATMYLNTGVEAHSHGTAHAYSVPWQAFECADDWIVVAVREEKFWHNLCRAMDLPELLNDPRFGSNLERVRNRDVLIDILSRRMRAHDRAHWLAVFAAAMVPSAPVLGVAEALDADPGIVAEVPYPPLGSVRMLKNPVRFGADEADYRPPPALGEHTEEVLVEVLGLAPAEVAALVGNGSAAGPVTGQ